MRKILCFAVLYSLCAASYGQADSTEQPVYLRFPTIPEFNIYLAKDSSEFTRESLKKRKATVFIIFSPDCEFCQHETKEIIKNIDKFEKAQIIMITDMPYKEMRDFYTDYKIADYPAFTMGKEAKYYLPMFFHIKYMPAIFVYDKKGRFKKAFEGSVKIEKILEEL